MLGLFLFFFQVSGFCSLGGREKLSFVCFLLPYQGVGFALGFPRRKKTFPPALFGLGLLQALFLSRGHVGEIADFREFPKMDAALPFGVFLPFQLETCKPSKKAPSHVAKISPRDGFRPAENAYERDRWSVLGLSEPDLWAFWREAKGQLEAGAMATVRLRQAAGRKTHTWAVRRQLKPGQKRG